MKMVITGGISCPKCGSYGMFKEGNAYRCESCFYEGMPFDAKKKKSKRWYQFWK
jgi:uncharacterized Zn ribbon protein